MEPVDVETGAVDIIDNTFKFLLECKEKGEDLGKQVSPSIYRVPSVLRDLSPSSFNPTVVSIGPLHRQNENLRRFEIQKMTYLHNLLSRFGCLPEKTLRECAENVVHSIERVKACYAESIPYNDFELAQMMVIDACFILEFTVRISDVSSKDAMFIDRNIVYDMLLIENQIPFFVLEDIYKCTILASGRVVEGESLTTHIEVLVKYCYLFTENLVARRASTHDHILGFIHNYYRTDEPMRSSFPPVTKSYSAMELNRAGMNFKPIEYHNWALAMKLELPLPLFSWFPIHMVIPPLSRFLWPTLRMPKLKIHDYSDLIIRNLITYEQLSDVKQYFTPYLFVIDMLIDTPEDVAMLVKSKVLHHYLGSHKEVANMINNLSKYIFVKEFLYGSLCEEMDAYYNSYWPNTIAGLKRTYFNNPWSIIALFAAFLLFSLTVVQTIFAIKAV